MGSILYVGDENTFDNKDMVATDGYLYFVNDSENLLRVPAP